MLEYVLEIPLFISRLSGFPAVLCIINGLKKHFFWTCAPTCNVVPKLEGALASISGLGT